MGLLWDETGKECGGMKCSTEQPHSTITTSTHLLTTFDTDPFRGRSGINNTGIDGFGDAVGETEETSIKTRWDNCC